MDLVVPGGLSVDRLTIQSIKYITAYEFPLLKDLQAKE